MSISVFYAVRFSPAPELGEWLNIAVVGEGITERNAGIVVTDSLDRIEAAFGTDAVERVRHLCEDLAGLVSEMHAAQLRDEETQPIPMALKDQALSVGFSDKIMVFEGKFEEALAQVANKYLSGPEEITSAYEQAVAHAKESEAGSVILSALQKFLGPPPVIAKPTESASPLIAESKIQDSTVLLIGDGDELGSALITDLMNRGNIVRVFDISDGRGQVVEVLPVSKPGVSVTDAASLAKAALKGVDSLIEAFGAGHKHHQIAGHDVIPSSLDGVDAVVYIADSHHDDAPTLDAKAARLSIVRDARARGAKRVVLASTYRVYGKSSKPADEDANLKPDTRAGKFTAELESELLQISDEKFGVTVLRFGELYGQGKLSSQTPKFPNAQKRHQTVNGVVAKAVFDGKVAVNDTPPIPFLHVEDAAESIVSVLGAPASAVAGQVFNVGADSEHRTFAQVADRVKSQVPDAEVIVAAADLESGACLMAFTKFSRELGFTPRRTVEEGIESVAAALRAAKAVTPPPEPGAGGKAVDQPELNIVDWEGLAKAKVDAEGQPATEQKIRKKGT